MRMSALATLLILIIGLPARSGDEGKLSEVHQKMAKMAGDYTTTMKFTMPDGKTKESKGKAKLTMVLDGRFLQEEDSGTMLGKSFTGLRLLGYNEDAGRFEGIWTYTGSTAMMTLVGRKKGDGKLIEFDASYAAGKDKKMEFVITYRIVDDDTFVITLAVRGDNGGKGPMMETTYRRKARQ